MYIQEDFPDAKIVFLYQNDDYCKDYPCYSANAT